MRIILRLFFICFGIFILSSCNPKNIPWEKYTSTEGAFSIYMPAPIKKKDKKGFSIFGRQVVSHFLYWDPPTFTIDKFKLFQVTYTDCPANICRDTALLNTMLDSAIITRRRDYTDAEIPIQNIALNGYAGRAFFYDGEGNMLVSVKTCLVHDRIYDFVVVSKKNYATNKEVSDFFDSFQSLK